MVSDCSGCQLSCCQMRRSKNGNNTVERELGDDWKKQQEEREETNWASWKRLRSESLKGTCRLFSVLPAVMNWCACWGEFWWGSCLWILFASVSNSIKVIVSSSCTLVVSVLCSVASSLSGVSGHTCCIFPRKSHHSVVAKERVGVICPWTETLWEL